MNCAEVASGAGIAFEPDNLEQKLQEVLRMSENDRRRLGEQAMARVAERYSWEAVTDQYERLLLELAR